MRYIDVNPEGWEALKAIPEPTHLWRTTGDGESPALDAQRY
jgi:hypothetical protein